ncbi:MAG: YDG domain-containing protein, partial [Fibromonadaceae bacterium]|nr:YDG domain-containing protein [Fibromonadaceae bacterium]
MAKKGICAVFSRPFGRLFGHIGVLTVLILVMGAWAQVPIWGTIDVSADMSNPTFFHNDGATPNNVISCVRSDGGAPSAACRLANSGDVITITDGNWILTGITGFRTVVVTPANDSTEVNLILNNVSISSGFNPPLTINGGSGGTVNLLIGKGTDNKFMAGGRGAAGIYLGTTGTAETTRVRTHIKDASGEGHSGELHARGAGAFGSRAGNAYPAGGGAGIGGNAAYCTEFSSPVANCRHPSAFGPLTIEGGKVFATGGMSLAPSSCNSNNSACGGSGAGIGGGGGIRGNNGQIGVINNTAAGGNIAISGGTVVVKGGQWRNGFTNGIGSGGTAVEEDASETIRAFLGTAPTLTITGGSLTAMDDDGPFSGGIGLTVTNRTRQALQMGAGLNTRNRHVTTSNLGAYGINGVYTDGDGRVYFWLPSDFTFSGTNELTLDSVAMLRPNGSVISYITDRLYTYGTTTDGVRIFDPDTKYPEIAVPTATPNSLLSRPESNGKPAVTGDKHPVTGLEMTGPYATGFRMRAYGHVAAVGHPIVLHKGDYLSNDGFEEAAGDGTTGRHHLVRWYRGNIGSDLSPDRTTAVLIAGSEGFLSDNISTITYIPGAGDYGKYIWAEILARDNATIPTDAQGASNAFWIANATVYPAIQVGAVVKVDAVAGRGFTPAEVENASISIMQAHRPLLEDGLVTDLDVPLVALVGMAGADEIGTAWKATVLGASVPAPPVGEFLAPGHTVNPVSFKMPAVNINDDIIIEVEVRNGSTPRLTTIEILPATGTSVLAIADVHASGSAEFDNGKNVLPKSGRIRLTFNASIVNALGAFIAPDGTDFLPGTISFVAGGNILHATNCSEGDSDNIFTCDYGVPELVAGTHYTLNIGGFANGVNPMISVSTGVRVEKKSTVTLSYAANQMFIVGAQITGTYAYVDDVDAGVMTNLCYYFEYSTDEVRPLEGAAGGAFDATECQLPASAITDHTGILTGTDGIGKENFGKWVRLVARPIGSVSVDGGTEGQPAFGRWERVGVLLVPGEDAKQVKTFSNVTFKGCDATNPDPEGIVGCTDKGFLVYDYEGVRLGANIIDDAVNSKFYKINSWKDDVGTTNNDCKTASGPFTCGAISSYRILESGANIPNNGEIKITPEVVEITQPKISSIELKDINDNDVNLLDGEGVGIAILANSLVITFDIAMGDEGSVSFTKGGVTKVLSCDEWGSNACTIDALPFEHGDFAGSPFNAVYQIRVSGFKESTGETMIPELFRLTTGKGPEVDVAFDKTEFAVGNTIIATIDNYQGNAGDSDEGTHLCTWETASTTLQTRNCDVDAGAVSSTYTPDTYGQNIRLVVTPRDDNDREGEKNVGDWTPVGVLLKSVENPNATNTAGGALGFVSINIGTLDFEQSKTGLVVYGPTNIRASSTVATDRFDGWLINTAPFDAGAVFSYTPAAPTGDIEFDCKMSDGDTPYLLSIMNDNTNKRFELKFSKDIVPVAGRKLVIVQESGGTGTWEYIIPDNLTPLCATGGATGCKDSLVINHNAFRNASGVVFETTTENRYRIGTVPAETVGGIVGNSPFMDDKSNYMQLNERLLIFTGGTSFYRIALSTRGIFADAGYGGYAVDDFTNELKVEVANESSEAINLTASLKKGEALFTLNTVTDELTNINSASDNKRTLTLNIASTSLNAGIHTDSLIIENVANGIREAVAISFTVRRQVIAPPSLAGLSIATRPYNGGTDADVVGSAAWEWSGSEIKLSDNVDVELTAGEFRDPNVGVNKPVEIHFNITGDNIKKNNYTFNANEISPGQPVLHSFSAELRGEIVPKPIRVVFEINPGELLGEKDFDGDPALPLSVVAGKYSLLKGSIDCPSIPDNGCIVGTDDVTLANPRFAFENADASEEPKLITEATFTLGGADRLNYILDEAALEETLKNVSGKINAVSLAAELAREGKYGSDCEVKAIATYGDAFSGANNWAGAPDGSCDVVYKGMFVRGNWVLENPGDRVVLLGNPNVFARFEVLSNISHNYINDLVMPVTIEVNPKVIDVVADLEEAGDAPLFFGSMFYNGGTVLAGTVKPSDTETQGLVGNDKLVGVLKAKTANFDNKDWGTSKRLDIEWEWETSAENEWGAKYAPRITRTIGSIQRKVLTLPVTGITDKAYDGSTGLGSAAITFGALVGVVAGEGSNVNHTCESSHAHFRSSNVNWNAVAGVEDYVDIIVDGCGLSGAASSNYTLELTGSRAKILQADLASANQNLGLKNIATYGSQLANVSFYTNADFAPEGHPLFPPQLTGILGGERVPGFWRWESDSELADAATTDDDGVESCEGNYAAVKSAIFEGQNFNYKPFQANVNLCVKPFRIIMTGTPSGAGLASKPYDGKSEADKTQIAAGDFRVPNSVTADKNEIQIGVEDAYYVKTVGGSKVFNASTDDLIIVVEYNMSGNVDVLKNYLPPANYITSPSMRINKRPLQITNIEAKPKYYDGTQNVDVDIEDELSNIVDSDDVELAKSNDLEFMFNNENAGLRTVLINKGTLSLSGTAASNYELVQPSLSATIYPASLANHLCPELVGTIPNNCATMSKEAKDKLLEDDLKEGVNSVVVAHLITELIETTYGFKFNDFVGELRDILPTSTMDLFGVAHGDPVRWTWDEDTDTRAVKVGKDLGYATVTPPNLTNFETMSKIPIPVDVAKLPLTYSVRGVDRPYKPGDKEVALIVTPLNLDGTEILGDLEMTGTGEMETDAVGNGKELKISFIGTPESMNENYVINDIMGGLRGDEPTVNIFKAEWPNIPSFVSTHTLIYDKVPLSARGVNLTNGWQWTTTSSEAIYAVGIHSKVGIVFEPPDLANYNVKEAVATLIITARSQNDELLKTSVLKEKSSCGANFAWLDVSAEDPAADVWFNDKSQGTGSATFEVTGLEYGNNAISYGIKAQCFDVPLRDYTINHTRNLPFASVTRWLRDKTLAVSLDSSQLAEQEFFRKHTWDLGKTEWYNGANRVGTGYLLDVLPGAGDYSVLLFTTTG